MQLSAVSAYYGGWGAAAPPAAANAPQDAQQAVPAMAAAAGVMPPAAAAGGEQAMQDRAVAKAMEGRFTQAAQGIEPCQTCKDRKYQDGSNDPGVSFKTPQAVDPSLSASAVMGHEQEHVVRERAKAAQEGARVVMQTVTLHGGICPECGRHYIAGGTTRTVTKSSQQPDVGAYSAGANPGANFMNMIA